jgi:transposase
MVLDGIRQRQIAVSLGYHLTTIRSDIRKLREEGQLPPPHGRTTKSVLVPDHPRATTKATRSRPERALQRAEAFKMVLSGAGHEATAEKFGVSRRTITEWVQVEIEQIIVPAVEELRKFQVARLESYLIYLQPKIQQGDDKAVNAAIRISEQIAKYEGLYKPVKVDITHHELDKADAELADMVNTAKAKMALEEQQLREQANADRRHYGD